MPMLLMEMRLPNQPLKYGSQADEFKILVAAGVISENKINRYESNNEIKNKNQH